MPAGAPLWQASFTNADGVSITLGQPGSIDLAGRSGDWGQLPFEIQVAESPNGAEAAPSGVKWARGVLTFPAGLRPPAGGYIRTLVDQLRTILRPEIDEDVPNRGYLYFTRVSGLAASDGWRIPAQPIPFTTPIENSRDREWRYRTEFRFQTLSRAWEAEPATADRTVISPGGSWTATSFTLTPGGDTLTYPTWEFDGPASGSTDTLQISNTSTTRVIELTAGVGLAASERLIITTGFQRIGCKVYTINGDGSTGAFLRDVYKRRTDQTDFFPLRAGANNITITKGSASTTVARVSYRRRVSGLT